MIKKVKVIKEFPGMRKGMILAYTSTLDVYKVTFDSIMGSVTDKHLSGPYKAFTRDEVEQGIKTGYFDIVKEVSELRSIEELLKRKQFFVDALDSYLRSGKNEEDPVPAVIFENLIDVLRWALGEVELEYNEWSKRIRNEFEEDDN